MRRQQKVNVGGSMAGHRCGERKRVEGDREDGKEGKAGAGKAIGPAGSESESANLAGDASREQKAPRRKRKRNGHISAASLTTPPPRIYSLFRAHATSFRPHISPARSPLPSTSEQFSPCHEHYDYPSRRMPSNTRDSARRCTLRLCSRHVLFSLGVPASTGSN